MMVLTTTLDMQRSSGMIALYGNPLNPAGTALTAGIIAIIPPFHNTM